MFYRRYSIFCRVWLNSKTFIHAAFLAYVNHATHAKILTQATHAKISTHATYVTHAKILWTHATHATHAKIWPMPPTHSRYPWHPRDLADSLDYNIMLYYRVATYNVLVGKLYLNPIQPRVFWHFTDRGEGVGMIP